MYETNNQLLDNDFIEQPQYQRHARRKLLPWWFRFFTWVFMIMGCIAPIAILAGVFGINFEMSLYGFTSYSPFTLVGFLIALMMLFKGLTAFSLWFEKDWAIDLAILDAIIGLFATIISFFIGSAIMGEQNSTGFSFRTEIIFIIPYLIKSIKIHERWKEIETIQEY